MNYAELMQMDRSILPIIVTTETGSRTEFMKNCTDTRVTLLKALQGLVTEDSVKLHGSVNKTLQRIAVRVQKTMGKMYQIPSNLWQRMDYKLWVAWAVYNAYVKCYATKDNKLLQREWTDDLERGMKETFHEVLVNCYSMMMENRQPL